MLEVHRCRQIDWAPSAIVALATSFDGTVVAAARENGAIEIWSVAAGSVGWHCQLKIAGRKDAAVSSLVWCQPGAEDEPRGRLFSAALDGFITEWDLRTLQSKEVVESMGGSVWQLAAEHTTRIQKKTMSDEVLQSTGSSKEDEGSSDSEDVSISGSEDEQQNENREQRVALACEDGCVRIFAVADRQLGMLYRQSLPRIKGRVLSVAWTWDGTQVLAGGSDGCIHCWDIASNREVYRITAGIGGKGSASDLCIWDLLVLRDGTIVSGDSSGSTQFWDGKQGTLIQVQTRHNADVLALAASPDHRSVFSAGADGQVVQFHWVEESSRMADNPLTSSPVDFMMRPTGDKWVYVGGKRTHTHDVRALTVAFPIINEDLPVQKRRKQLQKSKLSPQTDYRKWALSQTAMLISGGNDAKLFAYPANSFLLFYPHDISPAPERPFFQLAHQSAVRSGTLMMAQHPTWVDVWNIDTYAPAPNMHHQSNAQPLKLLARIKCKLSGHITCSAISGNGCLVAVSDCQRPRLYQLEHDFTNNCVSGGKMMQICKKKLPPVLRATHCMIFSADSGRLLLAGPKLSVSVVDTKSLELVHTFQVPSETLQSKLAKAVIMLMSTSSDGQWLAAATSSGHVVVFNMETLRYHWTVPVFDGTPATAAVFHAGFSNVLIVSSAANQLYVLDVEMKVPGEWYKRYGMHIAKQLLEFPGGIVGLSLPLLPDSTSIIAYSSSAMCVIDFSKLMLDEGEEDCDRGVKAVNSQEHGNGTRELVVNGNGNGHKQNGSDVPEKSIGTRFVPFKNPVLFLGHTGFSSVFVVEKPWSEVLQQFPAPVFRHVFGT
ncbi:unnamed protein product [Sphagnum jensenii]|uniref:U3 small nucleolar RNA-associated protein 4 n=1 Tax=Sphagnum jensenii TaxID=128206 RepID=A0ABP1BJZ5_9BRYO